MKRHIRGVLVGFYMVSTLAAGYQVARAAGNTCVAPDTPGCTSGLPTFQYEALLGQMATNPTPNVQPLAADTTELGTSAYFRVVGGTAPIYDTPDGKPTGAVNSGFFSVNVVAHQGEWAELDGKRWLHADLLTNANSSTFAGVLIDGPLPYAFAWVLVPTRPSPVPGGTSEASTPMLERYQRVNIFATITVGDWDWLLVGPGQWIEQRRVARVLPTQRPDGVKGRWVAVDLYEQVLVGYEDDRMVYATLVSTGMAKTGFGTNKGLFHIWAHLKQDNMSGDMGGPDAYNLPAVPYVMYYDGSISLHGTYWHDGFGYRHSHGCVNLTVTDAHWIYDWTGDFYTDTAVYVYTSRDYIKLMPSAA